jgi:DNA-binding transcriptional regulator YdaS (Cro superfamily)
MTFDQLIKHFGTQAKAAEIIGCTQPTLSNWKNRGRIPGIQQLRIEHVTKGKLKADKSILKVSRA